MTDPEAREREVIELLEGWPWDTGSTVIGGYAVAAYGGARYSDDVDFTIPAVAERRVVSWLAERGFEKASKGQLASKTRFDQAHRFEKGLVTVDILVGFVRDREAKVDIPEHWIANRARRVRLDLMTGRVEVPVRVARPEALWALKLQSGRAQDLADLFSIRDEPADLGQVRSIFDSLMCPSLRTKLATVLARLDDAKIYADARSLRGLKDTPLNAANWQKFRVRAASAITFPREGR